VSDPGAASFRSMWSTLAPIGRDPATGGYGRLAYAPAELELRAWFVGEATARHLDVHEDRAGNLWAWWGDATAGDAVATGSHLDAVRQGGAFDGPLGVVSAFAAVDRLRARGVAPARPLAVVAFADEEGARFGVACAGSRVLTGMLAADRALGLVDDAGVSLAEALRASGRDPAAFGADAEVVRRIGVFVELHVEQGRALVDRDAAVGVATAIRPHGRWRFDLAGRADHAGTTRMEDRDDPMLRHAAVVIAADAAARRCGGVATVGRVQVEPNGVNAIASRVRTWLDARADDPEVVRAMVAEVAGAAGVEPVEESWTRRVELDVPLRGRVAGVVGRGIAGGVPMRTGGGSAAAVPLLATGAGHDAGILATAGVPTAMLFVRNPTGISHAPDERAEEADCLAGVEALTDVLADLLTGPDRGTGRTDPTGRADPSADASGDDRAGGARP
jgi:beta-ureidopropionase / N-carbamoyl-L-amino-acid hydrolase